VVAAAAVVVRRADRAAGVGVKVVAVAEVRRADPVAVAAGSAQVVAVAGARRVAKAVAVVVGVVAKGAAKAAAAVAATGSRKTADN
jgi:hypothetical protein